MFVVRSESAERRTMYYVIKTLANVTDQEAEEIRQKRDAHKAKRRAKKVEENMSEKVAGRK